MNEIAGAAFFSDDLVLARDRNNYCGMSEELCPVYIFRSERFASAGDTVVAVAPTNAVAAVYGNNGAFGTDGLSVAFGGAVVFKNDDSGQYFLGVWGSRNASRFRNELRTRMPINVIKEAPVARLVLRTTEKERPKRSLSP